MRPSGDSEASDDRVLGRETAGFAQPIGRPNPLGCPCEARLVPRMDDRHRLLCRHHAADLREIGQPHGMVNRVVPKGEALEAAIVLAERISKNAPKGVRASKKLIKDVLGVSEDEFWNFQRPELEEVFASQDAFEGATAFAEKREPNWQDK